MSRYAYPQILVIIVLMLSASCQPERSKTRAVNEGYQASNTTSSEVYNLSFSIDERSQATDLHFVLLEVQDVEPREETEGQYIYEDLEAGTYTLKIQGTLSDGIPAAVERTVEIIDQDVELGALLLASTATIFGNVRADENVQVRMVLNPGGTVTVCDDEGNFYFAELQPGDYLIGASADGYESQTIEISVSLGQNVQIENVVLDKKAKPVEIVGGAIVLAEGADVVGAKEVSVTLTVPDGATEYALTQGKGTETLTWLKVTEATTFTLQASGLNTVYGRFRDHLGNVSNWVEDNVEVDDVVPHEIAVTTAVPGLTPTLSFDLTVTATNANKMRFGLSADDLLANEYVEYASIFSQISLPDGADDGEYEVWYQFRNRAGLESVADKLTIRLVTGGIEITTVAMEDNETTTASTINTFAFTLPTSYTEPVYLEHSCDGINWARQAFASSLNIDITNSAAFCAVNEPAEQTQNLRFRIVDNLDLAGPSTSMTIFYDSLAPDPPVVTLPSFGSAFTTQSINISGSAEAETTVFIRRTADATEPTTTASGGTWNLDVLLPENDVETLLVYARDAVGNTSNATALTLSHDDIQPVISEVKFEITPETIMVQTHVSESITTRVEYGTVTGVYDYEATSDNFTDVSDVLLANLQQNTDYFLRVTVEDKAGNAAVSSEYKIRTYIDKTSAMLYDQVWDETESIYYVSGNIAVVAGVDLIIKKGVKVKMGPDTVFRVYGGIFAEGTAAERIEFSSNQIDPVAGEWGRIVIDSSSCSTSSPAGRFEAGSFLKYVDVKNGGGSGSTGSIVLEECGGLLLEHTRIYDSASAGVSIAGPDQGVDNNRLYFYNSLVERAGDGIVSKVGNDTSGPHGSIHIVDSEFRDINGHAVVTNNESVTIKRTVFYSTSTGAIRVDGLHADIEESIFIENPYVIAVNSSKPAMYDPNTQYIRGLRNVVFSTPFSRLLVDETNVVDDNDMPTVGVHRSLIYRNQAHGSIRSGLLNGLHFFANNFIDSENYVVETTAAIDPVQNPLRVFDTWWGSSNAIEVKDNYILDWVDDAQDENRIVYFEPFSTGRMHGLMSPVGGLTVTATAADSVDLVFEASEDLDVAGYYLYYSKDPRNLLAGTGADEGDSKIDTESGAVTCTGTSVITCPLTNLSPGDYNFAVTAYDHGGGVYRLRGKYLATYDMNNDYIPANAKGIDTVTNTFTSFFHGLRDGQIVSFDKEINGDPVGTVYKIVVVDEHRFSLVDGSDTPVDLTQGGNESYIVVMTTQGLRSNQMTVAFQDVATTAIDDLTNIITITDHSFRDGEEVVITSSATLPAALSGASSYFVQRIDKDRFQLARTPNGRYVEFSSAPTYSQSDLAIGDLTLDNRSAYLADQMTGEFTSTGTLPSGLSPGTTYYVVNADSTHFQVALSAGGIPISISDNGSGDLTFTSTNAVGSGTLRFTPALIDADKEKEPYYSDWIKFLGHESWYSEPVSLTLP